LDVDVPPVETGVMDRACDGTKNPDPLDELMRIVGSVRGAVGALVGDAGVLRRKVRRPSRALPKFESYGMLETAAFP